MFKNLFKNLLVIFCCFSILFSYSGSALARQTVRVPSGTTIPIVFKAPVNSDSLQKGDVISIVINQHVKINNRIVFKQGDTGLVYVENVKKSRHHGGAGFIEIREGKISDVFGNSHNIQLQMQAKGESRRPSAIFLSVIGVALIFIPFGIWRTGTPAHISSGRVYEGILSSPSEVVFP